MDVPFDRKFLGIPPVGGYFAMFDLGSKLGLLIIVLAQVFRLIQFDYDHSRFAASNEVPSVRIFRRVNNERTISMSIHVFAWRRRKSLERLCKSINRARFHNHKIPLHFHVDGEPLESVVEFVEDFKWRHGSKHVHLREERLGMPSVCYS